MDKQLFCVICPHRSVPILCYFQLTCNLLSGDSLSLSNSYCWKWVFRAASCHSKIKSSFCLKYPTFVVYFLYFYGQKTNSNFELKCIFLGQNRLVSGPAVYLVFRIIVGSLEVLYSLLDSLNFYRHSANNVLKRTLHDFFSTSPLTLTYFSY
jgi:hypothetical protein